MNKMLLWYYMLNIMHRHTLCVIYEYSRVYIYIYIYIYIIYRTSTYDISVYIPYIYDVYVVQLCSNYIYIYI